MSRISVDVSYKQYPGYSGATTDAVLVPIMCVYGGSGSAVAATKLITTIAELDQFVNTSGEYTVVKYGSSAATAKYEPSYTMAIKLIAAGLPVQAVRYIYNSTSPVADFTTLKTAALSGIASIYADDTIGGQLKSRNLCNFKFLTTGAYANWNEANSAITADTAYTNMVAINTARKNDAVALAETNSVSFTVVKAASLANEDVTMFWPMQEEGVPACLAYLLAYASSTKTNPGWLSVAGASRGSVSDYIPKIDVTEAQSDSLTINNTSQSSSNSTTFINPIMKFGSYGYRIYGDRTAVANNADNASAYKSFLNIKLLLCDIKKQIYDAASRIIFEPNDDITFINFKSLVNPLLDKMKTGRGIQYYSWTGQLDSAAGKINASLVVKPIESVQEVTIGVVVTDGTVEAVIEELEEV